MRQRARLGYEKRVIDALDAYEQAIRNHLYAVRRLSAKSPRADNRSCIESVRRAEEERISKRAELLDIILN